MRVATQRIALAGHMRQPSDNWQLTIDNWQLRKTGSWKIVEGSGERGKAALRRLVPVASWKGSSNGPLRVWAFAGRTPGEPSMRWSPIAWVMGWPWSMWPPTCSTYATSKCKGRRKLEMIMTPLLCVPIESKAAATPPTRLWISWGRWSNGCLLPRNWTFLAITSRRSYRICTAWIRWSGSFWSVAAITSTGSAPSSAPCLGPSGTLSSGEIGGTQWERIWMCLDQHWNGVH